MSHKSSEFMPSGFRHHHSVQTTESCSSTKGPTELRADEWSSELLKESSRKLLLDILATCPASGQEPYRPNYIEQVGICLCAQAQETKAFLSAPGQPFQIFPTLLS